MRRFALAIIVGLLSLSASGVSGLVIGEPCTGYEQPGTDDGVCPPTCVTCGCCAQPTNIAVAFPTFHMVPRGAGSPSVVLTVPTADSREILHVPKTSLL